MQKLLSYIFVFVTVLSIGCKKETVVSDYKALGIGSYVTLVKAGNSRIDYSNLANSKVSITVKEYGSPIDKIKVYVTQGTADLDRSKWKFVKEFAYSGETLLEVTATQIATALGIPVSGLEPGGTYTLYNQLLTKDARIFDAANTYPDFASISNYNMALTWTAVVVCPFVAPIAGSYKVIKDDWVDWSPGDIVQVTDGPGANQVNISAVWPNPAFGSIISPLVVNVDPASGAATITSGVNWGDYGGIASTGTGSSGYVFSCTGQITLKIHVLYNGGDQGFLNLILKKQ